jgi:hypothetical protein
MYFIGVGTWSTEKHNLLRIKKKNENWILINKAPPKCDVPVCNKQKVNSF